MIWVLRPKSDSSTNFISSVTERNHLIHMGSLGVGCYTPHGRCTRDRQNAIENHQYLGVKMPVKSEVVCRVKELF